MCCDPSLEPSLCIYFHKNIFCDPSLEPSHQDGSNDGSQNMFNGAISVTKYVLWNNMEKCVLWNNLDHKICFIEQYGKLSQNYPC